MSTKIEILQDVIQDYFDLHDLIEIHYKLHNDHLHNVVDVSAPFSEVAFDLIIWYEQRYGNDALDLAKLIIEERPHNSLILERLSVYDIPNNSLDMPYSKSKNKDEISNSISFFISKNKYALGAISIMALPFLLFILSIVFSKPT